MDMITDPKQAIPQFVEIYKTLSAPARKDRLQTCHALARSHPSKDTRDLNTLLYLELLRAEKELTPVQPKAENPVVTQAEFRAAAVAIVRPIALISGIGSGLYMLGAAVVAIAESTHAFFLAYGWVLFPAIMVILLLSAFIRGGKSSGHSVHYSTPEAGQSIHINITRDGGINVNQQ